MRVRNLRPALQALSFALALLLSVGPLDAAGKAPAGKVDLNTADEKTLEGLPGVGAATAKAIIAARPFKSVDDLKKVKGIGDAKYAALKDKVTVSGASAAAAAPPAAAAPAPAPAKAADAAPAAQPAPATVPAPRAKPAASAPAPKLVLARGVGRGGRAPEDDGDTEVPAAVLGGVIARLGGPDLEKPSRLDLLLQERKMVFLEEPRELVGEPPLGLVVILDGEGGFGADGGALRRNGRLGGGGGGVKRRGEEGRGAGRVLSKKSHVPRTRSTDRAAVRAA